MIKLLERQEIFNLNKVFATLVARDFDLYNLHPRNDVTRYDYLPLEKAREESLKDFLEYEKNRDDIEIIDSSLIKWFGGGVLHASNLELPPWEIRKQLSQSITAVSNSLNISSWFILHVSKNKFWLEDPSCFEDPEVKISTSLANQFFRDIGVTESFNGGFEMSGEGINRLLPHILTLNMYDQIRMMSSDGKYFGVYCHRNHGTFHFDYCDEKEWKDFMNVVSKLGYVRFSDICP